MEARNSDKVGTHHDSQCREAGQKWGTPGELEAVLDTASRVESGMPDLPL